MKTKYEKPGMVNQNKVQITDEDVQRELPNWEATGNEGNLKSSVKGFANINLLLRKCM